VRFLGQTSGESRFLAIAKCLGVFDVGKGEASGCIYVFVHKEASDHTITCVRHFARAVWPESTIVLARSRHVGATPSPPAPIGDNGELVHERVSTSPREDGK